MKTMNLRIRTGSQRRCIAIHTAGHVRTGFTLTELLIVMAILVLLVSLIGPRLLGSKQKADINAVKTQIGMFQSALERYAVDMNTFPSTEDGLQALVSKPGSAGDSSDSSDSEATAATAQMVAKPQVPLAETGTDHTSRPNRCPKIRGKCIRLRVSSHTQLDECSRYLVVRSRWTGKHR